MALASRNGLLHVVSPQKSLSVQEHRLYLLIQIIQANLANFPVKSTMTELSCPFANKNRDFSKFLSMGKSHSVAFFRCPIYTRPPHLQLRLQHESKLFSLLVNMGHMKADGAKRKQHWTRRRLRWDHMRDTIRQIHKGTACVRILKDLNT